MKSIKTVDHLSSMNITINGEAVESIAINNPCQMWRQLDALFAKHGNEARIQVTREDGTLFKDWTRKQLKDGTWIKVNSIKETNRGFQMRVKREAAEAAAKAAAEAEEQKKAERKAKKAAADKARRERKKAEKAAAAQA